MTADLVARICPLASKLKRRAGKAIARLRGGRSVRYLIPDGVRESVLESRVYADRKAE